MHSHTQQVSLARYVCKVSCVAGSGWWRDRCLRTQGRAGKAWRCVMTWRQPAGSGGGHAVAGMSGWCAKGVRTQSCPWRWFCGQQGVAAGHMYIYIYMCMAVMVHAARVVWASLLLLRAPPSAFMATLFGRSTVLRSGGTSTCSGEAAGWTV